MNARNGKIARLPRDIRDQLNQRLEQSEQSPELLEWLNALPEVQRVVKDHFAGVPISPQNLSQWRQGGFQEWLARRDLAEDAREVRHLSDELDSEDSQSVLADDAAVVLAARFGSLLANWNGEVDEPFEARARVLNGLCRSVVQLQRGMHRSLRENFDMENLMEERDQHDHEEDKRKMLEPLWSKIKEYPLAQLFGGGEAGRKIAQFILAVKNDREPESDLLPTDKFAHEEASPEEAESVKPPRKRRTVKPAGKTKPKKAANPLEENEMECEKKEESSQDQSKSIKVNQSDLSPISPILPISPISPEDHPEAGALQRAANVAEKADA
jgi:hypothetical protein